MPSQYQKILERLKALEREISGGAMAVVAVLLNNKLYVANVGEPPTCPIPVCFLSVHTPSFPG